MIDLKLYALLKSYVRKTIGTIPESYEESNIVAYIDKKAQEVLESVLGGSGESVESVLNALNEYKKINDAKVDEIYSDYLKEEDKEDLLKSISSNAKEILRIDNALKAAIENDGEGLDSIKELATWFEAHGAEAAGFAAAIEALEQLVGSKTVAVQIAEAIAAENLSQYAKTNDLNNLSNKVDTGEKTVSQAINTAINALKIEDYAKAAELVALINRVTIIEEKVSNLEADNILLKNTKLDKNLSSDNAGKFLFVNVTGDIVPNNAPDFIDIVYNEEENILEFNSKPQLPGNVSVDSSLTQEGMAAESKATGDAIKERANIITEEKEGNYIVAEDSSNDNLKNLKIFGKTMQNTTTGAQLYDIANQSTNGYCTVDGNSITIIGKSAWLQSPIFNIDIISNKTLYLSTESITGGNDAKIILQYYDESNNRVTLCSVDNTTKKTNCIVPDGATNLRLIHIANASNAELEETTTAIFTKTMVSYSDTSWESYSGGQASPNPDYPQELENVGASGEIGVGLYGKNLLRIANVEPTAYIKHDIEAGTITYTNYAPLKDSFRKVNIITLPAGEYMLTGSPIIGCSYETIYLYAEYKNMDGKKIYASDIGKGVKIRLFQPTELLVYIVTKANVTITNMVFHPMIKLVSILDNAFEVGKTPQSITLSTPNGLPAVPTDDANLATYTNENGKMWIADEVDLERGKYIQRVNNYICTGSETLIKAGTNWQKESLFSCLSSCLPTNTLGSKYLKTCFCTHLIPSSWEWNNSNVLNNCGAANRTIYMSFDTNIVGITDSDSDTEKLEKVKAFLATQYANGTPITFRYVLLEPLETDLSAEEIAQYKALKTNYPVTTLLNDCDAHMKLTYNTDTKNYITQNFVPKNLYEQLEQRVIALENLAINNA